MWKYVATIVGTLAVITVGAGGIYLFTWGSQMSDSLHEAERDLKQADRQMRLLRDDLREKEDAYAGLMVSYRELQSSGAELLAEHEALILDAIAIDQEYQALLEATGSLQEMQRKMTRLEAEVATLERQRQPLLLQMQTGTSTVGFLCTGSMEPKMTCLDTMTWLTDFDPADITVGSIIVYSPPCGGGTGSIAHRVTRVQGAAGIYAFRTKPDAGDREDTCWIPSENVQGYLVDIQKNVRPGNALLRQRVNDARADYLYLREVYRYTGALADWRRQNAAREKWQCWVESAWQSQYEGHIPFTC